MEVHENNAANMNDDNNAAAEAAEDEEAEEENEDEIEVVTVNNAADFIRIRNTYNGTSRRGVFRNLGMNTPLFRVIIGPTITEIPNAAFRYCETLIEVVVAVSSDDDDRTSSIIRRIGHIELFKAVKSYDELMDYSTRD